MTDVGDAMLARMVKGPERGPVPDGDLGAAAVEPGEGQLLYGLVRALRPKAILEIGAGRGYSTLHLAAGVWDNDNYGSVYSVEPDDDRRFATLEALVRADLLECAVVVSRLPEVPLSINLAFVDAYHEAGALQNYLGYIEPRLAPGGVVVIHDAYLNDHVRQALAGTATAWRCVLLPGTSRYGLAILTRET